MSALQHPLKPQQAHTVHQHGLQVNPINNDQFEKNDYIPFNSSSLNVTQPDLKWS